MTISYLIINLNVMQLKIHSNKSQQHLLCTATQYTHTHRFYTHLHTSVYFIIIFPFGCFMLIRNTLRQPFQCCQFFFFVFVFCLKALCVVLLFTLNTNTSKRTHIGTTHMCKTVVASQQF